MKEPKLEPAEEFATVKECLKAATEKYAKNVAFVVKNKEGKEITYTDITYEQFGKDMRNLGTALIDLGLENKRIAIIGKNSYEWAITYGAVLSGVGVTVPLDKGLQENETIMSLQRSKADAIVFDKEFLDLVKKIKSENNTNLKYFICMNSNEDKDNLYLYDLIKKGAEKPNDTRYEEHKINPDEMSTLVFTSGTTSKSKAVMLSQRNIASNIYGIVVAEKIYDTDVNMAFLPMHHMFGSTALLMFLSRGAKNVFCDGLRHIQENLKEYKVSVFVCVPLLLEGIYKKIMAQVEKQGKTNLIKFARKLSKFLLKFGIDIRRKLFKQILDELGGSIRFVVSGAAALDKEVASALNDFGILAVQGYGLTETAPVAVVENDYNLRSGSIGKPLPGVEVEIEINDQNEEGIGELKIKGPNVMLGYYEMEEETNKVLKDGWFYTGDLGRKDKDGFIFITGRQKNVIVLKNGKNIYPEEIEALIVKQPYVSEVMAFGKEKDDDLLLSVKIVYNEDYVKQNYPDMSEEDFRKVVWNDIKEINKTLPQYKYIKNLILTNEPMVKTTTSKIKRFEEIKKENVK